MNTQLKLKESPLFEKDGKLYETEENDFFISLKEVEIQSVKETYLWKGSLIPFELWKTCMAFLLWTQEKYKSESVITLFYNERDSKWAAHAFPQRGYGMTCSHRDNDPDYAEQRKLFKGEWIQFGSIHHHCNQNSFQSSVDDEDETGREGLHITMGNLSSRTMDYHARVVLGKDQHDVSSLFSWLKFPKDENLRILPGELLSQEAVSELRNHILKTYLLQTVLYRGVEIPQEWKDNYRCEREPFNNNRGFGSYGGYGSFHPAHGGGLKNNVRGYWKNGVFVPYTDEDKKNSKSTDFSKNTNARNFGTNTGTNTGMSKQRKLDKLPEEEAEVFKATMEYLMERLTRDSIIDASEVYYEDILLQLGNLANGFPKGKESDLTLEEKEDCLMLYKDLKKEISEIYPDYKPKELILDFVEDQLQELGFYSQEAD